MFLIMCPLFLYIFLVIKRPVFAKCTAWPIFNWLSGKINFVEWAQSFNKVMFGATNVHFRHEDFIPPFKILLLYSLIYQLVCTSHAFWEPALAMMFKICYETQETKVILE